MKNNEVNAYIYQWKSTLAFRRLVYLDLFGVLVGVLKGVGREAGSDGKPPRR